MTKMLMDPEFEPTDQALNQLMSDTHKRAIAKRNNALLILESDLKAKIQASRAKSRKILKVASTGLETLGG
ncbi:MAG TPA: hypothetical protein VIG90_15100 [Pedomonas sp.]|uniref:hypothetical protein n=1 Tax=Pedomonas sp. TaxID=2976421 RepID=UPI002F3F5C91